VSTIVGIAMVRVMGAIMTGIIMAGAPGAALCRRTRNHAVNEEIDATAHLRVLAHRIPGPAAPDRVVLMMPATVQSMPISWHSGGFLWSGGR
jgi:phospholipid/cholesterol/gamma-HCH transport system permease protein